MENLPGIYLASKSPRRRELLLKAHIAFELLEIDVAEDFPPDLRPEEVAEFLAIKKARVASAKVPGKIVLTADSVVIQDGALFGKPESRDEAIDILQRLCGNKHTVITGFCLMRDSNMYADSGRTEVWLAQCTRTEIEWYIDRYQPYDKAGSYGIQDWIGHCKVTRLEGSYNNVMGLPTAMVYESLKNFAKNTATTRE